MEQAVVKLLPRAATLMRHASRGIMLGVMSAVGAELETQLNVSRGLERTSDLNATLAQSESLKQELRIFILPKIRELLAENPIVLFMKGTPDSPECGFSKFASMLLKYNNVDFVGVDVLDDPALRQGIKLYGNWPTIPQLYVKGELVGGADIIQQLHETGELRRVCGLSD